MQADSGDMRERVARDLEAWDRSMEADCECPPGLLSSGRIVHIPDPRNRAIWTAAGGGVFCVEPAVAAAVVGVIEARAEAEGEALLGALTAALSEQGGPLGCRLDIGLYAYGRPQGFHSEHPGRVELLSREASGMPDLPEAVEHVCCIRSGGEILSWASNVPQVEVDDHRLHSVGVGTHREHRRKGLAKAVVGALVAHLQSEGDAALWVYEASNVTSLRLARSLAFREHHWVLGWPWPPVD